MEIRKTTLQDVDTVLDVFAAAKRYMRANGNASQWGDEYPDRSIVTYDIACGSSYVMLENGEIVGTFALFLGEDESYRVIEDGAWHLDQPYGTIHRLASNGKARGVSKACFDFCTAQIGYLRADTLAWMSADAVLCIPLIKNIMRENYDYLYGSGQKLIER